MGAEQDLRGPERSRGEHDDVSEHEPRGSAGGTRASCAEHVIGDPPLALPPLNRAHGHLGEDVRAVPVRVGEIVHEDRVLRAVVTAGTAVTAKRARVLPYPDGVGAVYERHIDIRTGYLTPQAVRRPREGLQLGQVRPGQRVR